MLSCRIRNIPTFLLEKCLLKDNRNVDNFDCWLQRTAEMHTFQTIPIFRLPLSFGISFFYSDMRSHFKTHFLLFSIRQNVCTIFGTWFGSNKQLTQQNMYWNRFFFEYNNKAYNMQKRNSTTKWSTSVKKIHKTELKIFVKLLNHVWTNPPKLYNNMVLATFFNIFYFLRWVPNRFENIWTEIKTTDNRETKCLTK